MHTIPRFLAILATLAFLSFQSQAQAAQARIEAQLHDYYRGDSAISGVPIVLERVRSNGKARKVARRLTNHAGRAVFVIRRPGRNAKFRLRAEPYGRRALSRTFRVSGRNRIELAVGRLPVTLRDHRDGSPIAGRNVMLFRQKPNGDLTRVAGGKTDGNGFVMFEPRYWKGRLPYRLSAISPVDGLRKYSRPFQISGPFEFDLGGDVVDVVAKEAYTDRPLAGLKLKLFERLPGNKRKLSARVQTDAQGRVVLDLEGLSDGRSYFLTANPYGIEEVSSAPITDTGSFTFRFGTLPVHLLDRDSGRSLAGIKLLAVRKDGNGHINWRHGGTTDAEGVVRYDPPPLRAGESYQFSALDPYGEHKRFYSPAVTETAPFDFVVAPDMGSGGGGRGGRGGGRPRKPRLELSFEPLPDAVPASGFALRGSVAGRGEVASLHLRVEDPLHGETELNPDFDAASGRWSLQVPASAISAGKTVGLTLEALDQFADPATQHVDVAVIDDQNGPRIDVMAPSSASEVSANGFQIHGRVSDETAVERLTLRVGAGEPHVLNVVRGRWSYWVPGSALRAGASPALRLIATDIAGNRSEVRSDPVVVAPERLATHWLNRLTFGVSPDMLDRIDQMGLPAWLDQQLHAPETIPDEAAEALGDSANGNRLPDIQMYLIQRAILTRRQLQEVMAWFWDNHFNTDVAKTNNYAGELHDFKLYREHALGRFRDLLEITATSPSMVYYLDNARSDKHEPNENYARELMELHTLGVDGGYSEEDVAEVARVFTGWTVVDRKRRFVFNPKMHDDGVKQVLGHRIDPAGMAEGEQVLDILARHPSTAHFICTKLARRFVSDHPPETLVRECARTFLDSDGDIAEVLDTLFHSPEFLAPGYFHAKYRNPAEYLIGLARTLPVHVGGKPFRRLLMPLSMRLFQNPLPTGWPDSGEKWISSSQTLNRVRVANSILWTRPAENRTSLTLVPYLRDQGLDTADEIVDFLAGYLLQGDVDPAELDVLRGMLGASFSLAQDDAEIRLKQLLAVMLAMPGFQLK